MKYCNDFAHIMPFKLWIHGRSLAVTLLHASSFCGS